MAETNTKLCRGCCEILPVKMFNKRAASLDGRQYRCRKCLEVAKRRLARIYRSRKSQMRGITETPLSLVPPCDMRQRCTECNRPRDAARYAYPADKVCEPCLIRASKYMDSADEFELR